MGIMMTVGQNSPPPPPPHTHAVHVRSKCFYSDQDLETGTQWILF